MCVCPPEIFLCVVVTEDHDAPTGVFQSVSEIGGVYDEVYWSRCVYLWREYIGFQFLFDSASIFRMGLTQLSNALLIKDILQPEVCLSFIPFSSLTAKQMTTVITKISLQTMLYPLLNCIQRITQRAQSMVFLFIKIVSHIFTAVCKDRSGILGTRLCTLYRFFIA